MLKTAKARRDALEAIEVLENEEIPAEEARRRAKGVSERVIASIIGPMRAQVARLRHDVALYDRVAAGDLSMFTEIEEIGQLLIAARIARGITQRQLAEQLETHESQVSRDERFEYQGLTVERLGELCRALDLDLRPFAHLRDLPDGDREPVAARTVASTPMAAGRAANPFASHAVPGQTATRVVSRRHARWPAHQAGRWHAVSLSYQEGPGLDVFEVSAGLERVGVIVLPPEANGTAGATGPEGPFVHFSLDLGQAA